MVSLFTLTIVSFGNSCDCASEAFLEGPSGGGSVNVKCANEKCGAKFNICWPFTPQRLAYSKKDEENLNESINNRFEILDL